MTPFTPELCHPPRTFPRFPLRPAHNFRSASQNNSISRISYLIGLTRLARMEAPIFVILCSPNALDEDSATTLSYCKQMAYLNPGRQENDSRLLGERHEERRLSALEGDSSAKPQCHSSNVTTRTALNVPLQKAINPLNQSTRAVAYPVAGCTGHDAFRAAYRSRIHRCSMYCTIEVLWATRVILI